MNIHYIPWGEGVGESPPSVHFHPKCLKSSLIAYSTFHFLPSILKPSVQKGHGHGNVLAMQHTMLSGNLDHASTITYPSFSRHIQHHLICMQKEIYVREHMFDRTS